MQQYKDIQDKLTKKYFTGYELINFRQSYIKNHLMVLKML